MADEANVNPNAGQGTPEGQKPAETPAETKSLTAEEVQKMIQSAEDKVRTEYTKKLTAAEKQVKAKMTEEEIKAKELADKEASIIERENAIIRKDLEAKTNELLTSKQLPMSMREFVMGNDEDSTNKKIEAFDKLFKAEVEKTVTERLKGKTPDSSSSTGSVGSSNGFFNTITQNQRKRG